MDTSPCFGIQKLNIDLLPKLFYEVNKLFDEHEESRQNSSIPQNTLTQLLSDFKSGKGDTYIRARNELLRTIPVNAVEPLWEMKNKFFSQKKKFKMCI